MAYRPEQQDERLRDARVRLDDRQKRLDKAEEEVRQLRDRNQKLQAIVDTLLPVAQIYVDAFRADEKMTLPERLRLQQVEDILDTIGGSS
jgi:hypothetical protein